jgi:hypothetical protein
MQNPVKRSHIFSQNCSNFSFNLDICDIHAINVEMRILWQVFKVIWKAKIAEYFHLICHLILTKINCITLKIRSKADFKSKSQNIWQQIIMFSSTVMQMIWEWHKIWTLSGRLSLMRNVQLMKKKNIYIFRVYHIRIIAKKNWFTRHETDRFLNNHCQECVRAYLSIHDCLSFLHEVMIGNHRTKTFLHRVMIGNHRNKTTES